MTRERDGAFKDCSWSYQMSVLSSDSLSDRSYSHCLQTAWLTIIDNRTACGEDRYYQTTRCFVRSLLQRLGRLMLLSEMTDLCCSTDLLADDERYYQTARLLWKIVMIKGLVCFGRSLLSDDLIIERLVAKTATIKRLVLCKITSTKTR